MTELERNKRISEENERISFYFKNLDENKKAMVEPLIQNAAFMRVALDDLQEIIAEQGPVEAYQNGENQRGMKQSAALQAYNQLVKHYAAVEKSLYSLLPPPERPAYIPPVVNECKREEERQRAEIDFAAAVNYQKWQREEEAAGRKATISFGQWRMENDED